METKNFNSTYEILSVKRKFTVDLFQCASVIPLTTKNWYRNDCLKCFSIQLVPIKGKKEKLSENSFWQNIYKGKVKGRQTRFLVTFLGIGTIFTTN